MKKLNHISLVAALLLSLSFFSCGDNKEYTKQIETADSLFTIQKFEEAKTHYVKALELKKDEVYPTNQITKIDELLTQKIEFNYQNKIKEADAFFENKEYDKAKKAYTEANSIKPGDSYATAKLNEITTLTTEPKVDTSATPYHIIAGSYEIESNAIALQKKFTDEGRESTIQKSRNGNYLVSLNALATLNEAYNYLITLEDDFDTSIWVYRID